MSDPFAIPPAQKPEKKREKLPWMVSAGLVAATVAAIVIPLTLTGGADPTQPVAASPTTTSRSSYRPPSTTTTTSKVYYTPVPADFGVTVKVTRKACFGSAGCNITYHIAPSYAGPLLLDPAKTVRVTYEVTGDESGPQIGSFEMDSEAQASVREEEFASTKSTKTELKAKVTDLYTSR